MENPNYKNENYVKEPIFKGKKQSCRIRKRFYKIARYRIERQRSEKQKRDDNGQV